MSRGAPHWVYKRDQALRDSAHMSYERKLQDRITELEKENSDLKKKIAKMENAFLTAVDLLAKKY
jgi:hypothetical protein